MITQEHVTTAHDLAALDRLARGLAVGGDRVDDPAWVELRTCRVGAVLGELSATARAALSQPEFATAAPPSLFTPRYDGRDRWLQRTFACANLRRPRDHRPGDTTVLE